MSEQANINIEFSPKEIELLLYILSDVNTGLPLKTTFPLYSKLASSFQNSQIKTETPDEKDNESPVNENVKASAKQVKRKRLVKNTQ